MPLSIGGNSPYGGGSAGEPGGNSGNSNNALGSLIASNSRPVSLRPGAVMTGTVAIGSTKGVVGAVYRVTQGGLLRELQNGTTFRVTQ